MPIITEQQKNKRRDQILDAACRCFSRHGYHAASMKQVCAEAGLSPGAVYNYFDSKDEIMSELVTRGREARRRVLADESGAERLFSLLVDGDGEAARLDLSIWAAALNDPKLARLVQEVFQEVASSLEPSAPGRGAVLLALLIGLEVQLVMNPDFDASAYLEAIQPMLNTHE